jgi:SAM-dependent methyltransferase
MAPTLAPWCFRCPACGTWGSNLSVDINGPQHRSLDEDLRETGLAAVREYNNAAIVDRLRQLGAPSGGRLLDVGSAHGWFLSAARSGGFAAEGIEPDEAVAKMAADRGPVRVGFFPDLLDPDERFDVITFNDVLEHIPDVRAAVEQVHHFLAPNGLLSVNIPNSRGLVYRAAARMKRLGVGSVFERLWQVGLPSPHVWYFDEDGLTRLVESVQLRRVHAGRLKALTRDGLWERAHFDRRPSPVTLASTAAGWLATPVVNAKRYSDVMHLVFRRGPS